eukprot:GHVS01021717.1.p1 GENE.GHVS01021717.1~~GHVS01021717.1.p1  ORF type:complete len:134 (-),score=19.75 GHVS01021717.1:255-656(-)
MKSIHSSRCDLLLATQWFVIHKLFLRFACSKKPDRSIEHSPITTAAMMSVRATALLLVISLFLLILPCVQSSSSSHQFSSKLLTHRRLQGFVPLDLLSDPSVLLGDSLTGDQKQRLLCKQGLMAASECPPGIY